MMWRVGVGEQQLGSGAGVDGGGFFSEGKRKRKAGRRRALGEFWGTSPGVGTRGTSRGEARSKEQDKEEACAFFC